MVPMITFRGGCPAVLAVGVTTGAAEAAIAETAPETELVRNVLRFSIALSFGKSKQVRGHRFLGCGLLWQTIYHGCAIRGAARRRSPTAMPNSPPRERRDAANALPHVAGPLRRSGRLMRQQRPTTRAGLWRTHYRTSVARFEAAAG
jgi:hypothetical protein